MSIRERAYHTEEHYAVLILVLMEDALRVIVKGKIVSFSEG